ncbi:Nn.00g072950.m01.CDS01 [Neocucurbitaria sp. VM-36]
MAPDSNAPSPHRPTANVRSHTGLENLLPASITKRSRSSSRSRPSATPQLERSISSMTDSFMLEHWGPSNHSPPTEVDSANTPKAQGSKDEDALTPISNWAHLSYMKTQRNALRGELKAHQIAGAEAKRSVASLRRLAFRMAINISVKEKQIATSAKNLARNRKTNYLEGKDAQRRIEDLKRALRVEEGRNQEILEALERASMLTLEYSTPRSQVQHRRQRNPLSPPPSPPTHLANFPDSPLGSPRTPTRANSSSWHDTEWGLTPSLETPAEIRTSDSRLIRAKRESDQALAACRSRIGELQAECAKSKEDGKLLEVTREGLELEIQSHQSRIATLERSRTAVEDMLKSTKAHLDTATESEEKLKRALEAKTRELVQLERTSEDKQQLIYTVQEEKDTVKRHLQVRNAHFRELEIRANTLEEDLHRLQNRLKSAESQESSLRDRLAEKESAREDLRRRLDRGRQYMELLQQRIAGFESLSSEQMKQIELGAGAIAELREQLQQSGDQRKNVEDAIVTLKTEMELLTNTLQAGNDERDGLISALKTTQSAKADIEEELRVTRERLEQETGAKANIQSELEALRSSYDTLKVKLQTTQEHVQSFKASDAKAQAKLEIVRDAKAALEADLRDARQTLFRLREELRTNKTELSNVELSKRAFQEKLQRSEERVLLLEEELELGRKDKALIDKQHATELQGRNAQLRELESSVFELHAALGSSEKLRTTLQDEWTQVHLSKDRAEGQLGEILQSKADLQNEFDSIRSRLVLTESESADLRSRVTRLELDLSSSSQSRACLEERLNATMQERESLKKLVSDLEAALKENQEAKMKVDEALSLVQMDGEASGTKIRDLYNQLHETQVKKEQVEKKLEEALGSKAHSESQLAIAQSKFTVLETRVTDLLGQISALNDETTRIQQSKKEVGECLEAAQASRDDLDKQLDSTQLRLQTVESEAAKTKSRLSETEEELIAIHRSKTAVERRLEEISKANTELEKKLNTARQHKTELENRLGDALRSNSQLEKDLVLTQTQVSNFATEKEALHSKFMATGKELDRVRTLNDNVQKQLDNALGSNSELRKDVGLIGSRLHEVDMKNAGLANNLTDAVEELDNLKQIKADVDGKLNAALLLTASLEKDLSLTHSRVYDLEARDAWQTSQLTATNNELAAVHCIKAAIEEQLKDAEQQSASRQSELSSMYLRLNKLESEEVSLTGKLSERSKEMEALRVARTKLECDVRDALGRSRDLESDLRAVEMRLDIAESEGLTLNSKYLDANREIISLRNTNSKLEVSEEDLLLRLASAEEDLDTVRETNARLEAFLEQVETDMATAETAVEESEKRLEEFVEESQAKLDAVRNAKLKYKRRLSERNNEIEILINENSELHHQLDEKTQEVGALEKGKVELLEELSDKKKYIQELQSSNDKRMRSMNSTYNQLRKKYEEQKRQHRPSDHDSADRFSATLQAKDTERKRKQDSKDELTSPFTTLEQEVQALKEDKKVFERLVETLQDKLRQLQVLEEWQAPTQADGLSSPHHVTIQEPTRDEALSSPPLEHDRNSRPTIGHPSVQTDRPTTRSSAVSQEEDLDSWAREVERVRMLRNETAIQLKDMKKARHDLKKSLKSSEAQLHQLEKQQAKPKHHRALLRKSRPSTPLRAVTEPGQIPPLPRTPSRPATSAGFPCTPDSTASTVRHSTILSSPSTPSPESHLANQDSETGLPQAQEKRESELKDQRIRGDGA